MVAYPIPKRLTLSLTPIFAIAVGAGVALACMLMPADVLEIMILDSGIPAVLPAAAPPLGWTARTALAMIAGGGAAAVAWLGAFLLLDGAGTVTIARRMPTLPRLPALPRLSNLPSLPAIAFLRRRSVVKSPDGDAVPVLRRADAHPDAPARAPLRAARDLGVPFLDVRATVALSVTPPSTPPVECDLPRDLDAPLSAFDPHAIPDVPAEPIRAVAALTPARSPAIQQEGERFETFELRPPVAPPLDQPPIAAPRTDATIHALLDRLERGVGARAAAASTAGGVDDMLGDLRRLATR